LTAPAADNDFWRFSLRVYCAPGVEDDCLAVQERYDVNVNAMLLCAWLAAERRIALTPSEIEQCRDATAEWNERAVKPLRAARRAMKGLAGGEAMRKRVKELELEAEQTEQAALYEFAEGTWPGAGNANPGEALRSNLDLLLRAHGAPGPDIVPTLLRTIEAEIRRRAAS
jgi:uncharacterized protein (TIGR02444 family)